jgi:hypothetical protein
VGALHRRHRRQLPWLVAPILKDERKGRKEGRAEEPEGLYTHIYIYNIYIHNGIKREKDTTRE